MSKRVTVTQAASNALAAYLAEVLPDVRISSTWPSPDTQLPEKAITIIISGAREDMFFDPEVVGKKQNIDESTAIYTWSIATCKQDFQLDVWATSQPDRDDICARLEDVLRAGDAPAGIEFPDPVSNDLLLKFDSNDGWDGYIDFLFDSPIFLDNPNSVQQVEYRATYRGSATFELTVDAVSPRLLRVILKERLFTTETAPSDMGYDDFILPLSAPVIPEEP